MHGTVFSVGGRINHTCMCGFTKRDGAPSATVSVPPSIEQSNEFGLSRTALGLDE